jgi:hypothetical protein
MAGRYDRLNRLERQAFAAEETSSEKRWEQADEIVGLLATGDTRRTVAENWVNPRTGEPYDDSTVGRYERTAKKFADPQTRPEWSEGYNKANPGAGSEARMDRNALQLPKNEQGLINVLEKAARTLENQFDRSTSEIAAFIHQTAPKPPKDEGYEKPAPLTPVGTDKLHAQNALAELRMVSGTPARSVVVIIEQIMLEAEVRLESVEVR